MPASRKKTQRLSFAVRDELASRIASGRIKAGDRLPPEPELASELGVSRATLREALRSLEEDGFVTRTSGAGTYATHRPRLRNNLDVNFGVTQAIRASGMDPGTATSSIVRRAANEVERGDLALPGDAMVVEIERIRTADGKPVVLSRDIAAAEAVGEGFEELDGSVYELLERTTGRAVHHGVVSLEPMTANRQLATRLQAKVGARVLYLRQVDFDADGAPLLLSHEYHLADAFEFTVVRRGPGRRGA